MDLKNVSPPNWCGHCQPFAFSGVLQIESDTKLPGKVLAVVRSGVSLSMGQSPKVKYPSDIIANQEMMCAVSLVLDDLGKKHNSIAVVMKLRRRGPNQCPDGKLPRAPCTNTMKIRMSQIL